MLLRELTSLSELSSFLRNLPSERFARITLETDGEALDVISVENVPIWDRAKTPRIVRKRK